MELYILKKNNKMKILVSIILTFFTFYAVANTTYNSVKEFINVMKKDIGFGIMVTISMIMYFVLFLLVMNL